jgi:regulator of protease activity HflC (stomatin/prohibitin superfamily)
MNPNKLKLAGLFAALAVVVVLLVVWVGMQFLRPYDRPEYHEVDTSESAFLIPLEGDSQNQTAFPSIQFLEERKVAVKRVQIPHRWSQTGRLPTNGEWLATVRLIKVDRRPVTREWTRSASSGTSAKDQAIAVESRDSVNMTVGIAITANIPEESAALFLYTYPSKSLSEMMDTEVRARVQQVLAEEAAKYDLHTLLGKKNEIMKAVREDVGPFFKGRGIQIATVGMLGGLQFDNPEIQKAIDDSVKAGQLKVAAEAKREAQEVENKRLKLEAEGKAEAARLEAKGQAEAEAAKAEALAKVRVATAEAEAEAMKKLADARVYEAERANGSSDTYVRLRALEAEAARWKQWDGKFPTNWAPMGSVAAPWAVLFPPTPADQSVRVSAAERK